MMRFLLLCRQVQTCPSKILGHNVERLRFIQLLVGIYCLRLAQARIFFSVLYSHDKLIIVLRKLTIDLKTLILFEGGRMGLNFTADLRELALS